MFDVVAIGELLIDFTPAGRNESGAALFAMNPGGAPANVLAMNSRLGGRTAFIGKVGKDGFGSFLKKTIDDFNIFSDGLKTDDRVNTTLAFVQLDENGDRSFSFYRSPGADMMLLPEEVDGSLIDGCGILHFGSVSLTDEPSRSATLHAIHLAKQKGCIISYDPNYRPLLWKDAQTAISQMRAGLSLADIVKVSKEELVMLTGEKELEKGTLGLCKNGSSLVLVSLGTSGAFYRCGGFSGLLPTYNVKTIDTNGAGDAFLGAVHFCLRNKSLDDIRKLQKEELEKIVRFANAAGSLTTTKSGAITALPTLREIGACLATVPLFS